MTQASSTCPDCGTALPSDSPQQLCPSCLLKQAFASRTVDQAPSELSPPPSPEEIADKFPQFEITECLGRGGMGVVYKARQKSLNRWVAIKVLAPERVDDEKFAERFAREAQTLAQLNHPNIVTVHDYGETDGLYYIVMEFVDGVNLRDLLRDGKIESTQALTIVPPICEALQYAHDKGIVHRDIKPENLLIDRDGRVKIADFGIASLVGASGEQSGTPPYMAPEQGSHTHVDHRADIYALGAVLYEMLTGDRPNSPLNLPSQKVQLDIRIDDIVLRALSKEPERRYRSANEFRTVVQTVTNPSVAGASRSSLPEEHLAPSPSADSPPPEVQGGPREPRGMFRRWWWIFLVMIPLAPILGGLGGFLYNLTKPKLYEASTTYEYRPEYADVAPTFASSHSPLVAEQMAYLHSPEFIQRSLDGLNIPDGTAMEQDGLISTVTKSIEVRNLRGTDLIQLSVRLKNPELAARVVHSLVTTLQEEFGNQKKHRFSSLAEEKAWENTAPQRIIVHEEASVPTAPIGMSRMSLLIGAGIGFLAFPLLALILMALLQKTIPDRNPPALQSKPNVTPEIRSRAKLSFALFLAGTLGALILMALSPRHDIILVFAAICLLSALILGIMSWRAPLAKVVVIIVGITPLIAIPPAAALLFFDYRTAKLEAMHHAQEQVEAAREAARRRLSNEN